MERDEEFRQKCMIMLIGKIWLLKPETTVDIADYAMSAGESLEAPQRLFGYIQGN